MLNKHYHSWHLMFRIVHFLRDFAACESEAPSETLTITHEKLMGVVFGSPEGLMLKDIAREMRITPGAASQAVDMMVRQGLLERLPSEHDRRAVIIKPTAKCRGFRDRTGERFDAIMKDVLARFTAGEREVFVNILEEFAKKTAECRSHSVRQVRKPEPVLEGEQQ